MLANQATAAFENNGVNAPPHHDEEEGLAGKGSTDKKAQYVGTSSLGKWRRGIVVAGMVVGLSALVLLIVLLVVASSNVSTGGETTHPAGATGDTGDFQGGKDQPEDGLNETPPPPPPPPEQAHPDAEESLLFHEIKNLTTNTKMWATYEGENELLHRLLNPEKYHPELAKIPEGTQRFMELCKAEYMADFPEGTIGRKIREADCGQDAVYRQPSPHANTPWNVALLGSWPESTYLYSGCKLPHPCPRFPKCQIYYSKDGRRAYSDPNLRVVIGPQQDIHLAAKFPRKKNLVKVLYWREAIWNDVTHTAQLPFDFEMGIHTFAGILNPDFTRQPSLLMGGIHVTGGYVPIEKRPNFAIWVISDCHAPSMRSKYLSELGSALGPHMMHGYGACGDRKVPERPIMNALKVIVSYKFYMSFENTIQDGYVTEKLFWSLAFPLIPVYYGSLHVPNITRTPSYIHAKDFKGPHDLAKYLLHLNDNPPLMRKYHTWKHDPTEFQDEYLDLVRERSPGPFEQAAWRKLQDDESSTFQAGIGLGTVLTERHALCCRLCDPDVVAEAKSRGVPKVQGKLGEKEIHAAYWGKGSLG